MLKSSRVLVHRFWVFVLDSSTKYLIINFKSCVLVLEACVLDSSTVEAAVILTWSHGSATINCQLE